MAASEWGLGVGVRERRRAEAKTEPIMKPTRQAVLGPEDGCASVGKEVISQVTGENEFYKGRVTSVCGRQEMGCVCWGCT